MREAPVAVTQYSIMVALLCVCFDWRGVKGSESKGKTNHETNTFPRRGIFATLRTYVNRPPGIHSSRRPGMTVVNSSAGGRHLHHH